MCVQSNMERTPYRTPSLTPQPFSHSKSHLLREMKSALVAAMPYSQPHCVWQMKFGWRLAGCGGGNLILHRKRSNSQTCCEWLWLMFISRFKANCNNSTHHYRVRAFLKKVIREEFRTALSRKVCARVVYIVAPFFLWHSCNKFRTNADLQGGIPLHLMLSYS